jgi:O-methyltransferase
MRPKRLARAYTMLADSMGVMAKRFGGFDPVVEDEFLQIYEKCRNYTATSWERMYALYKAVRYAIGSGLVGDFVECGVWRGGSVMMIAYTLLASGVTDRKLYLYDTLEGMSIPTTADVDSARHRPAEIRWRAESREKENRWAFAPLPEVQRNVYSTGFPESGVVFVKGRVEETIPRTLPEKISVLRLDTDWYASTRHELDHLYPRLTVGGVLIVDDYGHWLGAKEAVDEYFASHPPAILLNRIDYTGRVGIKSG